MANPVYARLAATAMRLIKSYGMRYTVTRAPGVVRDSDGNESAVPGAEYEIDAIQQRWAYAEKTSGLIESEDIKLVAVGPVVQIGDVVALHKLFRVIAVTPIKPGDLTLACTLQVRPL